MQIRVRAWHVNQKKMYYPEELAKDQLTLMPDGRGFINVSGKDTKLSRIYDHMIPLLSTGLRDKTGREIYAGDVLKIPAGYSGDYWQEEGLHEVGWGADNNIHDAGFCLLAGDGVHWSDCEIVGNIYEHPNLTGGGSNE